MIGESIGHYRILGKLGEGGMGIVYRAEDTILGREVAIKVLPPALTSDSERLARFEREARLLATLNHPHIAQIHALEEIDGRRLLVMELAEGATLAERLDGGPLPVEDVLTVGLQIAQALEAAHQRGIVHRDLKPANVMLTPNSEVKLLDFGLAKAIESVGAPPEQSQAPTVPENPTREGMLLGTPAYMSPEQARTQPVDRSTDIWAFGCVLFEMFTSTRAFIGNSTADQLAAVLNTEPRWDQLPAATPQATTRLLHRSLKKDRKQRLRDIGDAVLELEDAQKELKAAPRHSDRRLDRRRERWAIAAAALMTILCTGLILTDSQQTADTMRSLVFEISPPPNTSLSTWRRGSPVISPDGKYIVFSAQGEGREGLWLRTFTDLAARPLQGTEGAMEPFWSADSKQVAYSTSRDGIRLIDVRGGPPQLLSDELWGTGSWSRDGTIIFHPAHETSLFRSRTVEGQRTLEALTERDPTRQEILHIAPQFLPDGEHFLFFVRSAGDEFTGTYAASLTSPEDREPILAGFMATYAEPGYLLFQQSGSLVAQPFDPHNRKVTGPPATVIEVIAAVAGEALFSVSNNGVLTYREPFTSDSQIAWFDRAGQSLGTLPLPNGAQNPELSPDESQLAFDRLDPQTGWRDVWIWDFDRELAIRLTTHPQDDADPLWSPDGSSILFASSRQGFANLYRKDIGSSEPPELVRESEADHWPSSWSSDGESVILLRWPIRTGLNPELLLLSLSDNADPTQFLNTGSQELTGQFSPDGRWCAYVSHETGRAEVYVRPFPFTGEVIRVSTNGGSQPRWRGDGGEIYYLDAQRTLMAVSLTPTAESLRPSPPQELFGIRTGAPTGGLGVRFSYDVSGDGQSFLLNTAVDETRQSTIIVVVDWTHLLEPGVPDSL